jgi:hypothetical protein
MLERRRFKQDRTLRDRQAYDPRKETAELSPGARRDAILQDLRHDWIDSPERRPPR